MKFSPQIQRGSSKLLNFDAFGSSVLNIFRINKYLGTFPLRKDFRMDKISAVFMISINCVLGLCLVRSAEIEREQDLTKAFITYGIQSLSIWLCGSGCGYLTVVHRQEIATCYKTAVSLIRRVESLGHDVVQFPSDLTYFDVVPIAGLATTFVTSAFLYDWHIWPNCTSAASMFYWAATLCKLMEVRAFTYAGVRVASMNRDYVLQNRINIWAKGKRTFVKSLGIYHDTSEYCRLVNRTYKDVLLLLVINVFLGSTSELYLSFTYVEYTDRILSKVTSYVICATLFLALFDVLWSFDSTNKQAKLYNCAIRDSMIFVPDSLQYKSADILKSHLTASRSVQYTAAGYFQLDVSLLSDIAGAVTTYLFIVLQLNAP